MRPPSWLARAAEYARATRRWYSPLRYEDGYEHLRPKPRRGLLDLSSEERTYVVAETWRRYRATWAAPKTEPRPPQELEQRWEDAARDARELAHESRRLWAERGVPARDEARRALQERARTLQVAMRAFIEGYAEGKADAELAGSRAREAEGARRPPDAPDREPR